MTRRPPGFAGLGGGFEDAPGATPFLIASAAADLEIMKMLLAAGANPSLATDTNTTAVMAASGLNRGIGESSITEPQALATVTFLLQLGGRARRDDQRRKRAVWRRLPRVEHAARAAD
jgi:hypothetical protein